MKSNKIEKIRVTDNIGAIILISSAKQGKTFVQVDESIIKHQARTLKGICTTEDEAMLKRFIINQTGFKRENTMEFPNDDTKQEALKTIRKYMGREGREGIMISFSGHGIELEDGQVGFVIKEEKEGLYVTLTLSEIIQVFDESIELGNNKHLFMLLDFCHSGDWVNQLKKLNRSGISIQASCRADETAKDTDVGGLFLVNFMSANNAKGVISIDPTKLKINGYVIDQTQLQRPQFWGDNEAVKLIFGLKAGFNDWKSLEDARMEKLHNAYYIGQLRQEINGDTQQVESIPHGFGSVWNPDHTLRCFGEFNEGDLPKNKKHDQVEQLKGLNSTPGMKSLKVDQNSNLLYGTFENGYLSGTGTYITPHSGRWTCDFENSVKKGKFSYSNQIGWTFEGEIDQVCILKVDKVIDPKGKEREFEFKPNKPSGRTHVVDNYLNVFFGDFKNGKLNGEGWFRNNFGYLITACFKDDFITEIKSATRFGSKVHLEPIYSKSNGEGKWIDKSGNMFFGSFRNGIKVGHGLFLQITGFFYEGEFKDDLPNGIGKYTHADGDVYEGEFKDGQSNGVGKYTHANGNVHEGECKNSQPNGIGKHTYANGDVYEGEFEDGKPNGIGKHTYANGNVYEGEYKDDKRNGRGKYTSSDGDVHEGEYKDGLRNGYGKYTWENGNVYEGEFKDDRGNGRGKYIWTDRNIYEGQFKDGLPNGFGKFTFANNNIYEGDFKNGQPNGRGKKTYANEDVFKGEFKNGQRDGQGRMVYKNGKAVSGIWKSDILIKRETVIRYFRFIKHKLSLI